MATKALTLKSVEQGDCEGLKELKATYEAQHWGKTVLTLDVVVTISPLRVSDPVVASVNIKGPGTESVPEALVALGGWLSRLGEVLQNADKEPAKFSFPTKL